MYGIFLRTALFAAVLSVAACGGSTSTIEQINSQTQQELDLKEAYEKGLLTGEEYEQARARVLKQR